MIRKSWQFIHHFEKPSVEALSDFMGVMAFSRGLEGVHEIRDCGDFEEAMEKIRVWMGSKGLSTQEVILPSNIDDHRWPHPPGICKIAREKLGGIIKKRFFSEEFVYYSPSLRKNVLAAIPNCSAPQRFTTKMPFAKVNLHK